MRKSLVAFLLVFGMLLPLQACSITNEQGSSNPDSTSTEQSSETEKELITITFKQSGVDDVVKTVNKGETLTDIPTPQTKIGYTVAWDKANFSNLTQNVVINAIETPKTYTVHLNANDGILSDKTITVVYDREYELPQPSRQGYKFANWTYKDKNISSNGVWGTDSDETIELIAQWGAQWDNSGWTPNF